MRRSILALTTALAVVLTPLSVAAVEVGATVPAAPPTSPVDGTEGGTEPVVDQGDPGDPGDPVLEVDQRLGFVTAASDVTGQSQAVVESGVTALPVPQPGAEVYPRPADGSYDVRGGGFGHGIGMSQYGADGAGRAGLTHAQILSFYYPGTTLEKRTTGTVRIGITTDSDGVTEVTHRPGLVVSGAPGGRTYALPGGYDRWRVRATSATAPACTLEGRTSTGSWRAAWPSGMTRSCPVSFSSPDEGTVDLHLPGGPVRLYRGTLTATHRGTTSLVTVNHLPMQHYLRSVTMAEMPVSFHAQALRAQAVAARTYALRGAGGTPQYDTCDTTACQAYRGAGQRNGNGTVTPFEHTSSTAAVDATDGQVLTYDFNGTRGLATTMYSSSTGGHTTTGGQGHGYLSAHPDPYDATAGNRRHAWDAQLRRDGHGQWGGRVLEARVEGFTAGGEYTWAYASGSGLQLANPWPANADGLSSTFFTIVQGGVVERIARADRWEVAEQVSQAWGRGTGVVYVVNGDAYPDALSAASRAGVYDAPVLLTRRDRIPTATVTALTRLSPARIVVVGGTASVSATVAEQLRGYTTTRDVTRVGGKDRYEAAANVASYYPAGPSRVYLASGEVFPDALAGAALAGHEQLPLLLTRDDRLDAATVTQLRRLRPREVVVLGGPVTVSDAVARQAGSYSTSATFRRLGGRDRYAVMAQVAAQFPAGRTPAYVASGEKFPDALVGAALAGGLRGVPIVLTPNKSALHESTAAALTRQDPQSIFVLGGPASVSDRTLSQLTPYLR